jgi:hypothetical protein
MSLFFFGFLSLYHEINGALWYCLTPSIQSSAWDTRRNIYLIAMLIVIMLSVLVLNVVAPLNESEGQKHLK